MKEPNQLHANIKPASLANITQIQSPKSKIKLNIDHKVTMGSRTIESRSELKDEAFYEIPKVEDMPLEAPHPSPSRLTV
jgi:hypothetical protein